MKKQVSKGWLWMGVAGLWAATVCSVVQAKELPAEPGMWGYRPADGSEVVLNPPAFTWVHDKRVKTYTVQWARTPQFTDATTISNIPWCVYTHSTTFAPGTWYWRVKGAEGWGNVRSVRVPEKAVAFPMPTIAEQRARIPVTHPRLFLRPEDLPKIRERIRTEPALKKIFDQMKREADRVIARGPTQEPKVMGSARDKENVEAVQNWWPNRTTSDTAGQEAELIAFVWMISRDAKYKEQARRFVMALAAWNPDGPSNFRLNCEAGKAMLYHPVRAYDWAYDTLSDEDRAAFRTMWQRRGNDAWVSGEVDRGNGHLTRPYNSHGNRVWHKLAEVAIALYGEIPESEMWLDYAVNKFYAVYPVWSDDDGGWHEGLSYMSGYLSKVVTWLQFANSALQIDGLKKPFFAEVGDLPLYLMPPGSPNAGMGDLSFRPVGCPFIYYFARVSQTPAAAEWSWWLQETKTREVGGWQGLLYAANLPALPQPRVPVERPVSKIFRGTGLASLHTTLTNSATDVHLLFKADPFGTQSHGHNAQLGVQLNAFGECLLPANCYRDLHGSKFHYAYVHSTWSQNSVLVNGGGQRMASYLSSGSIVDAQLTAAYDYVRGEATAAYTGLVTRAERALLFAKPDVIVVYDDFEAPQPVPYTFMLHALAPFDVHAQDQQASVTGSNAVLSVHYLGTKPLSFKQSEGFNPPPRELLYGKHPFPTHWHLAATTEPSQASQNLIVLQPQKKDALQGLWKAERVETATAVGVRLTRGQEKMEIAFRKSGVTKATWNGVTFEGPVLFRK